MIISRDRISMNYEVLEALSQIAREKNVNRELVIETLEAGLLSAARKCYGNTENVTVKVDRNTGDARAFISKLVVEEEKDPAVEMSLEKARQIKPDAVLGDEIQEELGFANFGRNAIQTAKQILIQKMREAEREKIFEEFKEKIGEITSGSVRQVNRGDLVINLGRTEAILPIKEQIKKEKYHQGDQVRAYIAEVNKTAKGPQIILSRTHPKFLEKLFQIEVPEIFDGIVDIKAISREPGDRSKVAVYSKDEKIDPVGACVGIKGSRVQSIVRELNNEKIDIVQWSSDPVVFVARALSPAPTVKVQIDEGNKRIKAYVEEQYRSLAIGKSGQNARLAAMLMPGWQIDIVQIEKPKEPEQTKEPVPSENTASVSENETESTPVKEGVSETQENTTVVVESESESQEEQPSNSA